MYRTMLRLLVSVLIIASLTLVPIPRAAAHEAGEGTITKEGTIELGSAGALDDSYHSFFSALGLSIHAGDVLDFSWRVNDGQGPPVYFDIHAHSQSSQWETHYNVTAVSDSGSWTVPSTQEYMVLWRNDNEAAVTITYSFDLLSVASVDYLPLILLGTAGAVFALILWRGLRRRAQAADESTDED